MLLANVDSQDARLFGGVVLGDLTDDGSATDEVLARALLAYCSTPDLRRVVRELHRWRRGEPWAAWVEAAVSGWWELRPRLHWVRVATYAVGLAEYRAKRVEKLRRELVQQVSEWECSQDVVSEVVRGRA
jgi:hypothetical protein